MGWGIAIIILLVLWQINKSINQVGQDRYNDLFERKNRLSKKEKEELEDLGNQSNISTDGSDQAPG